MFKHIDNQFWKTVIDTMQEGLMLVDPDGKIIFINRAFEDLLGYSAEEVVGQGCEIFQCSRCYKERADGFEKYCGLFKEERVRSGHCSFRKKDGTPAILLKNAAIIRDGKGKVIGGVESLTDLSTIKAQEKTIENLRRQLGSNEEFQRIITNAPIMQKIFNLAESAAQSDAPLIIYGESGTGKELLAAAIHRVSQRRDGPFIKVNCASLNENLLESELFGHVKGAFTGADYQRVGRFEAAHNGTIFLDEIGDLPITTQTKILRVLQEREIERVGDHQPIAINVRVISATHKDLNELIEQKLFREDLYYRVGVIPIELPPLRERISDIPLLVDAFIKKIGVKSGKPIDTITPDALDLLVGYSWPGNVRELENSIEYAFVLCSSGTQITASHLPNHIREPSLPSVPKRSRVPRAPQSEQEKKQQLVDVLRKTGGNQTKAAKLLGVTRVTIWKRIKKYKVELEGIVKKD